MLFHAATSLLLRHFATLDLPRDVDADATCRCFDAAPMLPLAAADDTECYAIRARYYVVDMLMLSVAGCCYCYAIRYCCALIYARYCCCEEAARCC